MPLFTPPQFVSVPWFVPYVFLVGPIRGAPDWQNPLGKWFCDRLPDVSIASPRSEMWADEVAPDEKRRRYLLQETWEHENLDAILERIINPQPGWGRGVIFAWHPKEEVHNCKRAYAQTTRFEVGAIVATLARAYGLRTFGGYGEKGLEVLPPDGIFVGAEEGYSGKEYLGDMMDNHRRRFYLSLEEMREDVFAYITDK